MEKGVVRMLNTEKKFGFIQTESRGDFFFHRDSYLSSWDDLVTLYKKGRKVIVEFEAIDSHPKGPRAEQVQILYE